MHFHGFRSNSRRWQALGRGRTLDVKKTADHAILWALQTGGKQRDCYLRQGGYVFTLFVCLFVSRLRTKTIQPTFYMVTWAKKEIFGSRCVIGLVSRLLIGGLPGDGLILGPHSYVTSAVLAEVCALLSALLVIRYVLRYIRRREVGICL